MPLKHPQPVHFPHCHGQNSGHKPLHDLSLRIMQESPPRGASRTSQCMGCPASPYFLSITGRLPLSKTWPAAQPALLCLHHPGSSPLDLPRGVPPLLPPPAFWGGCVTITVTAPPAPARQPRCPAPAHRPPWLSSLTFTLQTGVVTASRRCCPECPSVPHGPFTPPMALTRNSVPNTREQASRLLFEP